MNMSNVRLHKLKWTWFLVVKRVKQAIVKWETTKANWKSRKKTMFPNFLASLSFMNFSKILIASERTLSKICRFCKVFAMIFTCLKCFFSNDSSISSWKPWRWRTLDLILSTRYINIKLIDLISLTK